jgi:hypothetical protein
LRGETSSVPSFFNAAKCIERRSFSVPVWLPAALS